MLLIINLAAKGEHISIKVLEEVDSTLSSAGFKKEVRSVIKPGREFSVTYDGPTMEKSRIEGMLQPLSERDQFSFSLEVEESVRFP